MKSRRGGVLSNTCHVIELPIFLYFGYSDGLCFDRVVRLRAVIILQVRQYWVRTGHQLEVGRDEQV